MIYFDNAATTKNKPDSVMAAFEYYVREIGVSPGRGSYRAGVEASRMLYQSRKTIGEYFGLREKTNVVFTKNSTEAINLFFNGILQRGDHVLISCYEHNAVLRPLHFLKEKGLIDYSVVQREDLDQDADRILDKYGKSNTRILALTLASNLTGRIVFNRDLMLKAKCRGLITFVDSSQGAGKIRINMSDDGVDYLAFTSHKDLLALPGAGGLCCGEKNKINPLIQGGTGVFGDSYVNPNVFPEGLEAGTLNMPAIWALKTGVEYVKQHWNENSEKEQKLIEKLIRGLKEIPHIRIYDENVRRVSTVGINMDCMPSNELVQYLDENNVAVRGGIHCAVLAHEALGTVGSGVVRMSLSSFNTEQEIDEVLEVLRKVGEVKCI